MLIATIDCLVQKELDILVQALHRDGIVCIPSNADICRIHETLGHQSASPIVIYGAESMNIPLDDCPRIWLCCGPTVSHDEAEAIEFHKVKREAFARKTRAMQCGFQKMTYVDVLCFAANEQAKTCVKTMNLDGRSADILLRHVKKPTSYI
jgi:hypothetical protein